MVKKTSRISLLNITVFFSVFGNSLMYILLNRNIWFEYFMLSIILLQFFFLLAKKILEKKLNVATIYILPLLVFVSFHSIIFTIFFSETWDDFLPRNLITALLAFYIVTEGITTKDQLKKQIWYLAFAALGGVIVPLVLYPNMIGIRATFSLNSIFWGGFWNPILISFVSTGWIFIGFITKETKFITKFFFSSLFLITWFVSFAGLSRTSLIILPLSLLVYSFSMGKFKNIFNSLISLSIIGLFIYIFFNTVFTNFLDLLSVKELANESRFFIWDEYLSFIDEYWLFGTTKYYRLYSSSGAGPHSIFLNWFVQYGIIGLLFYLFLLSGIIKSIKKFKSSNRHLYSSLLSWLVTYLILVSINQTGFVTVSLYITMALIIKWSGFLKYEDIHKGQLL